MTSRSIMGFRTIATHDPMMNTTCTMPILRSAIIGAWLIALVLASWSFHRSMAKAGDSGDAPSHWPHESGIARDAEAFTLVLFVHPHCPCSRATIANLRTALAEAIRPFTLTVVVSGPAASDAEHAPIMRWINALPEHQMLIDPAGHEARRFGALTSGHLVVYDAAGIMRYSGGLTDMRGHEGRSIGTLALGGILSNIGTHPTANPTYGCPIFNTDNAAAPSCCAPTTNPPNGDDPTPTNPGAAHDCCAPPSKEQP